MKSIKGVYKIGSGPSSSHTVGPYRAAKLFGRRYPDADTYRVVTMDFTAMKDGKEIGSSRILSIGGGSIRIEGETSDEEGEIYPQKNFTEILNTCKQEGISLPQFVYRVEGSSLREYLATIWKAMQDTVQRGLEAEGILPGGLGVTRKASILYRKRCYNESADVTMNRIIAAYAYAVLWKLRGIAGCPVLHAE